MSAHLYTHTHTHANTHTRAYTHEKYHAPRPIAAAIADSYRKAHENALTMRTQMLGGTYSAQDLGVLLEAPLERARAHSSRALVEPVLPAHSRLCWGHAATWHARLQ